MKLHFIIGYLFCFSTGFAQSGIDKIDFTVLSAIEHTRTDGKTRVMQFISDANTPVNIGIPAGLLIAGIIDNDKDMRQNALYVATSTASAALTNALLKKIFKRPRPFNIHISLSPVYKAGGYSLPSGHTSSAFSNAVALSRAYPKWYVIAPSLIWAGAVGYSRMYLGVHNPSDVLAGAVLGGAAAFGWEPLRR